MTSTETPNGELASNVRAGYLKLREAILRDELPPGSRISQVQLAAELEMSRGPLREALRLLEREGLIRSEHNRMVRVADVSLDDMVDLYAFRIVNESFAIALTAVSMTDPDHAALCGCIDRMAAAAELGDWDAWDREHQEFHKRLGAAAGERIRALLAEGFEHAERYRRVYRSEESGSAPAVAAREHAEIAAACGDRDPDRAARLLARHLARTALTILINTAPEYEPQLIREAVQFVDRNRDPLADVSA